eukprot:SAG31_NODE_24192_length_487_cov_0.654639_2_plen_74_part_01
MMYQLLERTKGGLQLIAKSFQNLVLEEGQRLMQAKYHEVGNNPKGGLDSIRKGLPIIQEMTKLHAKHKDIVDTC